jgi:hypothetical protein
MPGPWKAAIYSIQTHTICLRAPCPLCLPLVALTVLTMGCGAGKGPWDGLGAVMKTKVRTDIKSGAVKTKSGKIRSAREVAEHLHARFGSEEWESSHGGGKVNEVVVFYVDETEIAERPTVEATYDFGGASTKLFSYMMLDSEKVAGRERSCWCPPCSRARGPGAGMAWAGNKLCVSGCTCSERVWVAHDVKRTDAAGVANKKKQAQAEGHKMAAKLGVGMWIAVQVYMLTTCHVPPQLRAQSPQLRAQSLVHLCRRVSDGRRPSTSTFVPATTGSHGR